MNISLQLGEPLWREAGSKKLDLLVPAGSTVADLQAILSRQYPGMAAYLMGGDLPPTVFLGDELAEDETPLTEGARVMLVWAAAGG